MEEKIDPAFDDLIRVYRHFLDLCRLPRNSGYVTLEEKPFKAVKKDGFPSLVGMYDIISPSPGSPSAAENPSEHNGLEYTAKMTLKAVIDSVPELIEDLTPKSKAYYKKKV